MKPFVMTQMTESQLETLAELNRRVQKIPDDLELPKAFSCVTCHMVACALHTFKYLLKLDLLHGSFRYGFPHSQLVDDKRSVYDPYPVGMISGQGHGVLFVAPEVAHIGNLYETIEACKKRFERKRAEGGCSLTWNPNRIKSPCKRTSSFRKAVRILVDVMS